MAEIDYSKIAIGGLTLALLISLGFNVSETDTHFCRETGLAMECNRLSSTNNTCYPNPVVKTGSKYCSSGWETIAKEPAPVLPSGAPPESTVYLCSVEGCTQVQ